MSFSYYTQGLALRATPSQGFVTRNQHEEEEEEEGKKKKKTKREFNPLSGTDYMRLYSPQCVSPRGSFSSV